MCFWNLFVHWLKWKFCQLQIYIFKLLFFILVGGELRLDEVSEHYLSKSLCEGEECNHLKVQVAQLNDYVLGVSIHILLAIFHLWAFLMQSMFHCCFVCRSLMKPFNSWYWKFDSCRSVAYWSKKRLGGWPEKYSATHWNFFMFIAH